MQAEAVAERMLRRMREEGGAAPGAAVVVMLSGGRDSVCLLDLAVRSAGAAAVRALHVNYGLRVGADADERHCAELCARLGVALTVERPRRPPGPGNVQAWARDARYGAAAALAGGDGGAMILTGHTADDQVETILYRLASSPSRRALLGMKARDGRLARPLLGFSRAETTAYCEQRGLPWRDDPSNADCAYARSRVRHELLPAFARIHPAAAANVLRTAELLRDEAAVLDALVGAELDAPGARRGAIELARFAELAPALRRLVLQRLADDAAGRPVAGAARFAEQVAGLRRTGVARLDLGGGVRAVVEAGVLRAER